jgi:hypothetical protein
MKSAAEANPHIGPRRVAMLALLGLAADVTALKEAIEMQEQSVASRCSEIEDDIERLLGVA